VQEQETVKESIVKKWTIHSFGLLGLGRKAATSNADPRRQQGWLLRCVQGGRARHLAAWRQTTETEALVRVNGEDAARTVR
jgi:hypothetical protein